MRKCKDCIFWPVCEDWSKDYYTMLGGKNPFPLEGDILDECQLYKSNNRDKTIKLEAYREFAEKIILHRRKMSSSDFSGEFWDYAVLEEDIYATLKELETKLNENN